MKYLSIIIPAYNEERRIGGTLSRISHHMSGENCDYEIIVVDDGSMDGTIVEAERSAPAKEGRLKIIRNGVNRGKGFSVKNGIMNSGGEYIIFSDADLSTPIEEMRRLFSYLGKGYDIVIGSRSLKESRVKVHQPWHREMMGRVFNMCVRALLIESFNDTQCGFKLFKGAVARDIARSMYIDGFAFDVEMLYLAKIKGYKVKEVGIVWENSADSRVKLLGSPVNMFLDLFKIRKIHPCAKK